MTSPSPAPVMFPLSGHRHPILPQSPILRFSWDPYGQTVGQKSVPVDYVWAVLRVFFILRNFPGSLGFISTPKILQF